MIQSSPQLLIKEINDTYAQGNFKNLREYFNKQNQLLNFNFVEFNFTAAVSNQKIAHGLGLIPQDVIITRITGTGTATLNWALFDSSNLDVTTTGACRVRMFVGSYWNFQTSLGNNSTDTQAYSATSLATAAASSTTNVTNTTATVLNLSPNMVTILSGSGNYSPSYYFTISSGSATAGDTYTNNGATFTVVNTIASATLLLCTSTGAPSTAGVLTRASGTGDTSLTFSAARAPNLIEVRLQGGGGSGGGGGTSTSTNGTNGNDTTFGTLVAKGGGFGNSGVTNGGNGGTPGANTFSGQGFSIAGSFGSPGGAAFPGGGVNGGEGGGSGGASGFGGAGAGGSANAAAAGQSAAANSGSGGGGGGSTSSGASAVASGGGGASGGMIEAFIPNPSLLYAYVVAAAQTTVGAAGVAGAAGGQGASGIIVIRESWKQGA